MDSIDDSTCGVADLVRRDRLIPATDHDAPERPSGETSLTTDSAQAISDLREERL